MDKVNLEVMKPWVTKKLTDMLQFEDDVLIDYVFSLLDESVSLLKALFIHSRKRPILNKCK
jgi:hypothetical protein